MISKILLTVFVFASLLFPQQDFRILSSNQNSIVLEFSPQYLDTSLIKINDQEFRNTNLASGYYNEALLPGTPAIPERRFILGVPSEFGNSIRAISSTYNIINGKILPVAKYEKENFLDVVKYEISPEYYNYSDFPELASFPGDFGNARGLQVQTIRLFPVRP